MIYAVLDKSVMREYKRVVEKEGDPSGIEANVEAGWELLVKNGGNTKRYHDAVLKVECGNLVEDLIAGFGRRHVVSGDALTYYMGVFFTIDCLVVTGWSPTVPRRRNSQVPTRVKKMKMMRIMKKMTEVVKVD